MTSLIDYNNMRLFGLIGKFFNATFISAIMSMMVLLYEYQPVMTFISSILFYVLANHPEFQKYVTKNMANFCQFFSEASIGVCLFCFTFGYFTKRKNLPELSVILLILIVSFATKHFIYQKIKENKN